MREWPVHQPADGPLERQDSLVREGLARGLCVMWAEPSEGCILARTYGEPDAALCSVRTIKALNREGIEIVRRLHQPELFMERFTALVEEVSTR